MVPSIVHKNSIYTSVFAQIANISVFAQIANIYYICKNQ